MRYAQVVIGPAGSGKSTYCSFMQRHAQDSKRIIEVVNLDPAAEHFDYQPLVDIRDLIQLDDAMDDEELHYGPNGGLVFCLEFLIENQEWLKSQLCGCGDEEEDGLNVEPDDDYILFDMPGQIELFTHLNMGKKLVELLESWNFRICTVFLVDSQFMIDGAKFLSGTMAALSVMANLEMPHVNVLTKMDLLSKSARKQLDKYLDPDPRALLGDITQESAWGRAHRKLSEAIGSLIEDFRIKKTTPKQFETLVDLMCKNPNVAKRYHKNTEKSSVKEQWNEIRNKLNSIGPPTRETEIWMKVWADMKTSVKKKLIHNKTESRATGGGTFQQKTLTPLEEAVSGLLQMNSVVSPNGPTFGIETMSVSLDEDVHNDDLNNNDSVENIIMNFQTNPSPHTKKKIDKTTNEKNLLLEKQLQIQTDLYKDLKKSLTEIERYSRKSYKLQEEQLNLQKEKMKLYKEQIKKKDIHRSSLLKLRMEEIDIKRRKIEIEEKRITL